MSIDLTPLLIVLVQIVATVFLAAILSIAYKTFWFVMNLVIDVFIL